MILHAWRWLLWICLWSFSCSARLLDRKPETDSDLQVFVSRPDLRPPKFHVQRHDPARISAGYWFLAPDVDLHSRQATTLFVPGQTGPHIFDASGELVWSGAHLFGDRATFDFKTATCNGSPCMTFILGQDSRRPELPRGSGVVLDSSFRMRDSIVQTSSHEGYNMHEFTVTKEGTAISIIFNIQLTDVTNHWTAGSSDTHNISGWVGNNGFREIDVKSGNVLFEWWALDHVHPSESMVGRPTKLPSHNPWDFFHQNSVDKNDDGDYLISARYLNSIYKISGKNGSIIWQLGGRKSSFKLNNFSFSRQHDARFRSENATHVILSFLNNAADDYTASDFSSSGMVVSLDLTKMTAELVDQWYRPDHQLTRLRGNVQLLPNGNNFVCWSENGHVSEFSPAGDLVLDAQFESRRFVTYRAYKSAFTGVPSEPPAIKSFIFGPSPATEHDVTAIYISWNGATDVASWRFYTVDVTNASNSTLLGQVPKTSFETVLMLPARVCTVFAEAIASDGAILGVAPVTQSILPKSWDPAACNTNTTEANTHQLSDFDASSSAGRTTSHLSWGLLVDSSTSTAMTVIRTLLCCVFVLLLLLVIAAWKITQLRRRGNANRPYDYVRLDK